MKSGKKLSIDFFYSIS